MKPNTSNAAKFFAEFFGCSEFDAKKLNHMYLECMVKYAKWLAEKQSKKS